MVRKILLQKNGYVISLLAKELLSLEVGDKIKTIRDYSFEFKVGHGTVQLAIKKLIEIEAIEVEKKGHKGLYLNFINYDLLSELAGINGLAGVMPLPSSKKYEGLATGLFELLNQGSINTSLAFMTGAKSRIESLMQGRYHFAIISKNSFDFYKKEYPSLLMVEEFGNYTFISGHILLHHEDVDPLTRGIKMGIDKSSYDQISITEEYIKKNNIDANFVDIRYSSITDSILSKRIDAAIWSKDNLKYRIDGIVEKELDCPKKDIHITNACLVMTEANKYLIKHLKKMLVIDEVIRIQENVINEHKAPNY